MANREILREVAYKARQRLIRKNNKNQHTPSEVTIKLINNVDEDFETRAKGLLCSEDNLYNPFKLLMDEKVLKGLDTNGKERYLLSTVDKFARLRDKLERENEGMSRAN